MVHETHSFLGALPEKSKVTGLDRGFVVVLSTFLVFRLIELPGEFPLGKGDSIDVFEEEILYKNKVTEH